MVRYRNTSRRVIGHSDREKGLAKSGNARVRRGMIQLPWRSGSKPGPRKSRERTSPHGVALRQAA